MSDERRDDAEPQARPSREAAALRQRLVGAVRESGLAPWEVDGRLGLPAGTTSRLLGSGGELERHHVVELLEILGLEPEVPVDDTAHPARLTGREVVASLERHGLRRRREAPAPSEPDVERLAALILEAVDEAVRRARR